MNQEKTNDAVKIAPCKLRFTKPDGTGVEVDLAEGQVTNSAAGSHAVEDIGDTKVQTVQVERRRQYGG